MFYVKNVPNWERALRLAAGIAVIAYALLQLSGLTSYLLIAAAIGVTLSGLFGFCPMCAMIGRRLDKNKVN